MSCACSPCSAGRWGTSSSSRRTAGPEATLELARRAVAAHILEPCAGGAQLTFRHALVREALYAELLPRGARGAARGGARRRSRTSGGSAAELAYHHARGRAARRGARRLDRRGPGGRPAGRISRGAHPLRARARAVGRRSAEPAGPRELDRLDVRREAAEAARLTGEYDRAIEHCRAALEQVDLDARPRARRRVLRAPEPLRELGHGALAGSRWSRRWRCSGPSRRRSGRAR